MENIFLNIDFTTLTALMVRFLLLATTTGLLLWLIYFILVKTLFTKSKSRTTTLRLAFLWAIFCCFIAYNVYIFVIFYRYGIDSFLWSVPKFYLGILPQLLVFSGLIMLFYIKRYLYKKNLSINELN